MLIIKWVKSTDFVNFLLHLINSLKTHLYSLKILP